MAWSRIWQCLAPPEERDEALRQEIRRLAGSGLATLAAVEIAAPVATFAAHLALHPEHGFEAANLRQAAALITVGLLTCVLARIGRARPHARALALASAWTGAAVLIWTSLAIYSWDAISRSRAARAAPRPA
jgi:hypothetical protein